jgi:uncharacterized protein YoaH (UPF0181 family)
MTRTLTGLYDTYADAQAAVHELEAAGVSSGEISLVASRPGETGTHHVKEGNEAAPGAEAGAAFGAIIGGGGGLLAGLGMLAIPGVGPVVAAGWLVATLAGAAGGAAVGGAGGGLIGAMVGNGVPEQDAQVYAEGVRRGGTMVTVRVDDAQAPAADAILRRHHSVDAVERRRVYTAGGWSRFEESAPAFDVAEAERERVRRANQAV